MSQKTLKAFLILPALLPFLTTGCTRGTEPSFAGVKTQRWIVAGAVPETFQKAGTWNATSTCPKGSMLTPMMKYLASRDDGIQGEYYFGRACQVVTPRMVEESASRAPASVSETEEPAADARMGAPMNAKVKVAAEIAEVDGSYVPHGPFVFWYPDGKLMREGRFLNGTPEGEWVDYSPSGKSHARR